MCSPRRPISLPPFPTGALLQPILGGLLIGLWAKLQPYCLGEGTDFLRYLLAGTNNRTLAPSTLVGIGVVKLLATRTALSFGFVGGKFFPTMFLGGCVGCAIFLWCNHDSTLIIHRCSMPLVFPLTCLMANSVTSLGALFLSLPLCVILIFGLDGEQSSCVLLSCLTAYVLLHGIGRGLLPMVFERQVLAQLRLLRENNAALMRASVSGCEHARARHGAHKWPRRGSGGTLCESFDEPRALDRARGRPWQGTARRVVYRYSQHHPLPGMGFCGLTASLQPTRPCSERLSPLSQ